MAQTVNERLQDAAISHAIDQQQYATGVVRRMIALLNRVDPDLVAQLAAALDRLPGGSVSTEHMQAILAAVRMRNAQAYGWLGQELPGELRKLVEYEAGYQFRLFESVIPPQIGFSLQTVAVDQVYAAALARPFQGRLLKEWAGSIEADRMTRIRDAIRIGYVEQQTNEQIIRRVRGTKAKGYSDGLIEVDRRHAEGIVRTAVAHTAGFVRDRFYERNSDLIKAVAWCSTLDSRTSEVCRCRDGLQYTPTDHKPIGHKVPWLGGPGRAHFRCRSSGVPITRSFREMGLNIDDLSPSTRASMDGQIQADVTYGEWLQKQSAARQDQIVGPTRGKLMREGKLPFDRLYTNTGQYLTLEQLAERDAAAFKRAGVDAP